MRVILSNIYKREEKKCSVHPRITLFSNYFPQLLILLLLISSFSIVTPTKAQKQAKIILISRNKNGVSGNNDSGGVSISSDGRFILYTSKADNLVKSDTNDSLDLFLYDRLQDITTRPVDSVIGGKISANGRILSFTKDSDFFTTHIFDILTGDTQSISDRFSREKAKDNSWIENLSFDGRYITLVTSADNLFPIDPNENTTDTIMYDRINNYLQIISTGISETSENNASPLSIISDDGRIIAFTTNSSDLLGNAITKEIVFFDRVLGDISVFSLPITENDEMEILTDIDISRNGNKLIYLSQQINSNEHTVTIFDRQTSERKILFQFNIGFDDFSKQTSGLALSGNGNYLALVYPFDAESEILSRFNLTTGEQITIDQGSIGSSVDLSDDGGRIAYSKEINGIFQVVFWDETPAETPGYILAGRVTDSTGYPLALVKLLDDRGNIARTDGEGFFWMNEIRPGEFSLRPEKDGFDFEPKQLIINMQSDERGIIIAYKHIDLLKEAEKDIGMPYSQDRGENGPFHGYEAGYCTDLILDAFSWGVNYNIQFALEMDFRANPWHFYRWRDSRDAQDMWRFFSYTGQIQSHNNPYQPGDIVFFDWSQDGEIDHVSMVSKVTNQNRPLMMYDATGVINSNPSGLATELNWEFFHEETVRGFARWSGKYQSIIPSLPSGEVIQISLGSTDLSLKLLDERGGSISKSENEIIDGRFGDWIWEQSISLFNTTFKSNYYLVIISNQGEMAQPFSYATQFIQEGLVKGRIEFKDKISTGQIIRIPFFLNNGSNRLELGNNNSRIEGYLNVGNN